MNFADKLSEKILKTNSRVIVGLDPHLDKFPKGILEEHDILNKNIYENGESLERASDAVMHFNRIVIDVIYENACGVKLQSALYEALGIAGMEVMADTLRLASNYDLLTIVDGKRGDISSSMKGYLSAYFSESGNAPFECDAITVNPYMGRDVISVFNNALTSWGKGLFVLIRTSNPSASEIQNVSLESGEKFYEYIGKQLNTWGSDYIGQYGYSCIGSVVGLTAVEEAIKIREILRNAYLLLPGFGPQGGDLSIVKDMSDKNGLGFLIVSARWGLFENIGTDFKNSIKNNIKKLQLLINKFI
ncbi:MAG: orotidine-5'-phosphate decarboxylase [bacterium]